MSVLWKMSCISVAMIRPNRILKETRSWIYSKPPKNRIGAGQSFFVMCVFAVAMLTPAAWILHHLPEYRQRPHPTPKS
ncbi:cytochrome c oxidase subunit 8A, mitochondrial [Genypterus blacodes]|uniref:cytochrome c oxidase subunit 8A, mitochondrial n=1 Tax=Genypterus blacodes TaxID=154954 RepID=UPI003F76772C